MTLVAGLWLAVAASLDAGVPLEAEAAWPLRIDALELGGLESTAPFVVERELPWRAGDTVTREAWELGTARLWNTDFFGQVAPSLELRDGRAVARYELEEHFSLNPLFSFGVGGGRWWLRLGANDNNWLGRALEWGARYERFDVFNGGQAWLKDPRLFGRRLLGLVEVDFLIRPRPEYSRRRLSGIAEVSGELDNLTRLGARLEVFRDEYLGPLEGPPVVPPNLLATQVALQLKRGRVDTVRLRQRGASLELRETTVLVSSGPAPVVVQGLAELLWFQMLGQRFTVAARAQAALTSAAPTELNFYLGGLEQLRGYADSLLRTARYALVNLELRATLFDSTWFALVAAAFTDAAVADVQGARSLWSAGGGVRLLVPKLVKTGIRADVAVTLVGAPQWGLSFGVYQFF